MTHLQLSALDRLKAVGLRPTRQRIALANLLFCENGRHITAELLHSEARAQEFPVSLATIYNTLHQFTEVGLLREVVIEPGRSVFDTNTEDHHHFYSEETGELQDIPENSISLNQLPPPPDGTSITRVDVIIRLKSANNAS